MTATIKNCNYVPLTDIRRRKDKHREVKQDTEQFQNLCASIQEYTVLQPVTVIPDATGEVKYVLDDGEHRFVACEVLGIKEIPINIIDVSEDDLNWTQMIMNMQRKPSSPTELGKTLQRLLAQPKYENLDRQQVFAKLGLTKSVAWFNQQMKLNNLIPEAKELVDENKIAVSKAYYLARLPAEEQVIFLDDAQNDTTNDFLKKVEGVLQDIKDKKKGISPEKQDPIKKAKLRKLTEIKVALAEIEEVFATDTKNQFVAGQHERLLWILSMDPATLSAAEGKKKEKQAKRDALVKRRKELMAAQREQQKSAIDEKLQNEGLLPVPAEN